MSDHKTPPMLFGIWNETDEFFEETYTHIEDAEGDLEIFKRDYPECTLRIVKLVEATLEDRGEVS